MRAPITQSRRTRILLSADEWHLLTSRVPAVRVPVEFQPEWSDRVTPTEREEREASALGTLQQRGLVDAAADSTNADLTTSLHPAFGAVLSLPQVATTVLDIAAWGPGRTVLQSVSVAGDFCLGLARTQRVQDPKEGVGATPRVRDENSVEVTACGTDQLIDEALRSLDLVDDSASTGAGTVATVSLGDATALVLAVRTGDAAVIRDAFRRVGADPANAGFAAIATTITGGLVVRVHDVATSEAWAPAWFYTEAGWVRLGIDIGSEKPTADAVMESGTVSCRLVSRAAITADVTAALLMRLGF